MNVTKTYSLIEYTNEELLSLCDELPWIKGHIIKHLKAKPIVISIRSNGRWYPQFYKDIFHYLRSRQFWGIYRTLFHLKLWELPLLINDKSLSVRKVAIWRLKIGK